MQKAKGLDEAESLEEDGILFPLETFTLTWLKEMGTEGFYVCAVLDSKTSTKEFWQAAIAGDCDFERKEEIPSRRSYLREETKIASTWRWTRYRCFLRWFSNQLIATEALTIYGSQEDKPWHKYSAKTKSMLY